MDGIIEKGNAHSITVSVSSNDETNDSVVAHAVSSRFFAESHLVRKVDTEMVQGFGDDGYLNVQEDTHTHKHCGE